MPGRVLHLYPVCGVLRASWVPTDYPPLCAIQLAPHMVDDHWGRSYLGALKAAKAARTAAEPPPAPRPLRSRADAAAAAPRRRPLTGTHHLKQVKNL